MVKPQSKFNQINSGSTVPCEEREHIVQYCISGQIFQRVEVAGNLI